MGIDIGGSGIKGAAVDLATGTLAGDRVRVPTPQPATPRAVAHAVRDVLERIGVDGPVGITVPAVVRNGMVESAANIDESWIGTDADALFTEVTGRSVTVVNDADAAGLAEVRYGAGKGRKGVVLVLTLGTGIGSGLFVDGKLVPNSELGHLELKKVGDAEDWCAASAREREKLDWKAWAKRLQKYFSLVESVIWPSLIIIGGGVSDKHAKFFPYLKLRTEIVPAALENEAGIVGAAMAAAERVA